MDAHVASATLQDPIENNSDGGKKLIVTSLMIIVLILSLGLNNLRLLELRAKKARMVGTA
jgi:hypothetical protein